MTCRTVILTATLFVGVSYASAQANPGLLITCSHSPAERSTERIVFPRTNEEAIRFKQAPHGATRNTKRQLQVGWTGGRKLFTDKPPYNEPLDGVAWTYCGYSPALNLHLILKRDNDNFTGVLLDDKTGAELPAGYAVLFSPDGQRYVAYEQPDGLDGENLKLYSRAGQLIWKGYNGLLSPDGVYRTASFEPLEWDSQDRLVTIAHENGKPNLHRVLARRADNTWDWMPNAAK